jgi:thiol-disulfide isomerase/thioredoxin
MQSSDRRRLAPPISTLLLASLVLLSPLAAPAQQPVPSTPKNPSFQPIGMYALEIDGKPVPDAKFFHSQASGSILIETTRLDHLLELQPRGRVVVVHSADAFHRNRNGTLDRLPRAKPVSDSTFELVDSLPHFEIAGKKVAVREKPPLLGPQTAQSLVEHDPSYGIRAKQYQPQPHYLDLLRQVKEPVLVRVFLGTWCTVCAELMPHVLRVDQELQGSNIRFEYYGLPRDYDDPEARRLEVSNLPTGILYVNGEEVFRIVGYSWRFPDMSLNNAVLRLTDSAGR